MKPKKSTTECVAIHDIENESYRRPREIGFIVMQSSADYSKIIFIR